MDISALANINANTSNSTIDKTSLVDGFDTFLTLLMTQLQNQNPLEPLDVNQFTDQLVKFSTVEQQIKTNSQLENLLQTSAAANTAALVSYIGKDIEATGTATNLQNDKASWQINAAKSATEAEAVIRDFNGTIVTTKQLNLNKGANQFVWDGKRDNGVRAPDGEYQITVNANDDKGNRIAVDTSIVGKVSKIDFAQSPPVLKVGDIDVSLASLKAVKN